MLGAEPHEDLYLMILRPGPKPKTRVRGLTDCTMQATLELPDF